jgi:hypothetical protein
VRSLGVTAAIVLMLFVRRADGVTVAFGSAFSISGRAFVLQRLSSGMSVVEWDGRSKSYVAVAVAGLDPSARPLAITVLSDRAVAMLASEKSGQSLWRLTVAGDGLAAERMTPLLHGLDDPREIAAASPERFVVSDESGARVIAGGRVACAWRFGAPAFASAARGNEVLVATGELLRFVLDAAGCPERRAVASEAIVTGVATLGHGWVIVGRRGLSQAIVALDESLRPRWIVKVPRRGWLLAPAGAEAAVAWSPAEHRAYRIGAESVVEEVLPGDGVVDLVRGAAAEPLRFATDRGVIGPAAETVLRPSRAIPLPFTGRFVTPGELAAAFLSLSILAAGVYVLRRRSSSEE